MSAETKIIPPKYIPAVASSGRTRAVNLRRIKRAIQDGNYIPVPQANYELYTQFDRPYWTPARRVSVEAILIDKSRMDFQNEVSPEQVKIIIENFNIDFWYPIILDKEGYLLDGQHRLEIAHIVGLKYLDAVIQDTALLETPQPISIRAAHDFI